MSGLQRDPVWYGPGTTNRAELTIRVRPVVVVGDIYRTATAPRRDTGKGEK